MPHTPPPPNLPTQPSQPIGAGPDSDISYYVMPSFKQDTVEKEPGLLDQSNAPQGPRRRRLIYIAIAGAVILIALGFGIYVLSSRKTSQPQPSAQTSRLPKLWLIQYFGSEVCSNTKTCGDSADPDNDGLSNFEEFKEGANPVINDTDGDGLADGDEVLIYKTDPVLKFTDRREVASELGYTDGVQVKNGYDPLTPGIKFTDVRKQHIASDTQRYGLHEPTTITLKETALSPTPTPTPTPQQASVNCGSVVGVHLIAQRDQLTEGEKNTVGCMDAAITNCAPASIVVANDPQIGNTTFQVLGKNNSNCSVKNIPEKPTAFSKLVTCQVPLSLIQDVKQTTNEVFITIGLTVGFGSVKNTKTGEEIKLECV